MRLFAFIVPMVLLSACDRLPSWLATEKPPAPRPIPTSSASSDPAPPPEPPAVEWSQFKGPPDAVLDATRITLRVIGARSFLVAIEHDGSVHYSADNGCGTDSIPQATIGSLLAFVRANGFYTLQTTYKTQPSPTAQDEVHLDVRTPANDVFVVAERGSAPPKALSNIVSAIETVTAVDAHLPKLEPRALTQREVEGAVHKDRARLSKCKGPGTFDIKVDRLGLTSLESVSPSIDGPCVGPIVKAWKFAPACGDSVATVDLEKSGPTVKVSPARPLQ